MGFKKGDPKPPGSGRKKGTPNKKKLLKVVDILAEKDLNPVVEILKLMNSLDSKGKPALSPSMKITAWFDLLSYCQAKPKEVEAEKDPLNPEDYEEVSSADLLKLVKKPDGAS